MLVQHRIAPPDLRLVIASRKKNPERRDHFGNPCRTNFVLNVKPYLRGCAQERRLQFFCSSPISLHFWFALVPSSQSGTVRRKAPHLPLQCSYHFLLYCLCRFQGFRRRSNGTRPLKCYPMLQIQCSAFPRGP